MKIIVVVCILFFVVLGCETNTKVDNELSVKSVKSFQKIFNNLEVDGTNFHIKNVFYMNEVNINYKLLNQSDLLDISFFKLVDDSLRDLVITVNRKYCYASIANKYKSFIYPTDDVIYPSDFSFLNEENIEGEFNCKNEDTLQFRDVSYEKHLLGVWVVDSIVEYRKNYEDEIELSVLNIEDDSLIINNTSSTKFKYINDGPYFVIENSNYYFYKIFSNKNHLIFINKYNDSYIEYYFHSRALSK